MFNVPFHIILFCMYVAGMLYTFRCKLCAEFCLLFCFHLQSEDFDIEMSGSSLTRGMINPNVPVVSRKGEL